MNNLVVENLKNLLEQSGNSWIFLSPNSIGEVIFCCGFAKGFVQQHGGPLVLCLRPEHLEIPKWFYPNRFKFIIANAMELMRAYSDFRLISSAEFKRGHPINLSPLHYDGDRVNQLHLLTFIRQGYGGLSITDAFRYMLRLNWSTQIERPRNPCASPAAHAFSRKYAPGTYVVFFPGNNTTMPAPNLLWEKLSQKYLQLGFRVLVNLKGSCLNASPNWPPQVEFCHFGIIEAVIVSLQSHAVIGGANGLIGTIAFFSKSNYGNPIINILVTNKICIEINHSGSAVSYSTVDSGSIAHALSAREMIAGNQNVTEWRVNLEDNSKTIESICGHIMECRKDSPHIIAPIKVPEGAEPEPVDFDSKFIAPNF